MCYQVGVPLQARTQSVLGSLAVLITLAAFAVAGQGTARATVLPTLYVNYVGTNCTFTMVNDFGTSVASIAPGTYQLTLTATDFESCGAGLPDFQLSGPNVTVQSPIDNGTGAAADYTVTFQASSTYVAQDLNQPLSKITFTTQASGAPPAVNLATNTTTKTVTTSSSSSPVGSQAGSKAAVAVFRGTLDGTVNSAGKPTLTYKGKAVTQLTAGKYTFLVADHSKKGGFLLQEPPKIATTVTGFSFVGTRRATIDLTAGQALFYPTFIGAKNYFIVVAAH
jgi:hypothetical protein